LLARWDFSDPTTLYTDAGITNVTADGDAIYQANDMSGNGNHLVQVTLGARPIYKVNIRNGRSIGRFDGARTMSKSMNQTTTQTAFIVAVKTSGAGNQWLYNWNNGNAGLLTQASNTWQYYSNEAAGATVISAATTVFDTVVLSWSSASVLRGGMDGGALTTLDPSTVNNTAVILGGIGGSPSFIGDVAEFVIYDSTLSNANIDIVGRYLANKWGLPAWTAVS